MDLTPGTYVAMCFVEDPGSGMWHALQGMVQVFSAVDGGGTPAA
jgi:hypothetical protein